MKSRNSLLRIVLVVSGVAALYFGLTFYESYTTTAINHIAVKFAKCFQYPTNKWIVFSVATVLLISPYIVLNSFAVGLALSALRLWPLWKYALAVGVLSEVPWVCLSYILSMPPTTGIIVKHSMDVLGPVFAGYCIELVFHSWQKCSNQ